MVMTIKGTAQRESEERREGGGEKACVYDGTETSLMLGSEHNE